MNMDNDLEYEKSQMPLADEWYKNCLGFPEIKRCDFNTPEGKANQLKDIDCIAKISKDDNKYLRISEKFRKNDWGDIWLEIYDNYDKKSNGSYLNSKADILMYFTPNNVYVVLMKKLSQLVKFLIKNNKILKACEFNSDENTHKINLTHNKEKIELTIARSFSERNGQKWEGRGVCIKWDDLKKFNIDYQKFNR